MTTTRVALILAALFLAISAFSAGRACGLRTSAQHDPLTEFQVMPIPPAAPATRAPASRPAVAEPNLLPQFSFVVLGAHPPQFSFVVLGAHPPRRGFTCEPALLARDGAALAWTCLSRPVE